MSAVGTPAAVQSHPPNRSVASLWLGIIGLVLTVQLLASIAMRRSYGLTAFGDIMQSLLIAGAMAAMMLNGKRADGTRRTFWLLMASGCGLWLAAQLLWTLYEVVLRKDAPNPFAGDIILFLHVVPFMAAIALQPHLRREHRETALGVFDLALLVLWWMYLYLLLVIPWQLVRVDLAEYGFNFNLVSLLGNLACVAAVGWAALRSPPDWQRFYWHLFAAASLYAFGSQLADAAIDVGHYYTGSLYDLPLVGSMAWLTYAALSGPRQASIKNTETLQVWPGRVAIFAVLSIPVAAWMVMSRDAGYGPVFAFRLSVTLAAFFVFCALGFYKQHLLHRELLRLFGETRDSLANVLRLQNQLVQSEKLAALGQLVAGAAHEINNPLTAILGYSDLISQDGADRRDLAHKIGQQARRTKALVHNLLSFARESVSDKKSTDLNAIVTSAIRLQQVELVNSRITVEIDTDPSPLPVLADPNQLLQVVLHVLGNAIYAMREVGGGVLKLATRKQGQTVVLEVGDTGPGMREPQRVFDPFYTTKPVGKGTGLGLSMAYGIIQKHGGAITCWNNPGGGATFRIVLPELGKTAAGKTPRVPDSSSHSEEAEKVAEFQ